MADDATPKFARVVFQPAGSDAFIDLSIGGNGWTVKAGVEASLNIAFVTAEDFQRIGDARTGAIAFHYSAAPGAGVPDVTLRNITIVNAAPEVFGLGETDAAKVAAGTAKAHELRRGLVFKLFFADFRHRFISPRGGLLSRGKLNAKGGAATYTNSDLIKICLEAMGFKAGDYTIDGRIDEVPPPRDLQWLANHAPTELAKLLDAVGAAFCPQSDGRRVRIDLVGRGPESAVPEAQLVGRTVLPNFDRRGRTVVMTTGVAGVIKTKTFVGPGESNAQQTWEFVAQDFVKVTGTGPGGRDASTPPGGALQPFNPGQRDLGLYAWVWLPLRANSFVKATGKSAIQNVRDEFKDIAFGYRERARAQFYHYIRLNPTASRVIPLRKLYANEDGVFSDIRVRAKMAVQDAERRLWSNSDEFVDLTLGIMRVEKAPPHETEHKALDGTPLPSVIIEIPGDRLVRVDDDGNAVDQDTAAVALSYGQLEVTVSYYEVVRDGSGKPVLDSKGNPLPMRFDLGFTSDPEAGVRVLTGDELSAALADPETLIIHRPEQALVDFEGNTSNRDELVAEFSRRAGRYMRTDDDPPYHVLASGFVKGELSGRVPEISYAQASLSTTFQVNTWFLPAGTIRLDDWKRGFEAGSAFPGQSGVAAERIANGAPESAQPAVPLGPSRGGGAGASPALYGLVQAAEREGTHWAWKYTVAEAEKTGAGRGKWRAKPGGRTFFPVWNLAEDQNETHGGLGNGITLPSGTPPYPGTTFEPKPVMLGRPVKLESVRCTDGTVEYHFDSNNAIDGGCA